MASAGSQRPLSPGEKRKRDEDSDINDRPQHVVKALSNDTDDRNKKQRVIGPTMPPSIVEDKSTSCSDNESDDNYGPPLPPTHTDTTQQTCKEEIQLNSTSEESQPTRRDDWMLHPPEHGDWSSRVDPTKIRNRKFNMGRSATAKPSLSGVAGTWTETADEKRKRLEAEVMGIKAPASSNVTGRSGEASEYDAAMSKRVQEYNEKKRGETLYAQHQSRPSKEEEDDPSARPFDKDKDIRGPTRINHAQRRELLNRSSDFNTRFSGARSEVAAVLDLDRKSQFLLDQDTKLFVRLRCTTCIVTTGGVGVWMTGKMEKTLRVLWTSSDPGKTDHVVSWSNSNSLKYRYYGL
ncbi:hypothetical protein ACO22_07305 [Paracoccidioides brasiliensis]|uniref:DUF3752 domain-containing protein n=1 Tax=Paracoccidioides brasiliensis TaxID=121759 RepID=A0A1D2J535_PARBR|nr:hypothetical protein ACO22_07305 [Paracoccidioides brasiliensis]